MNIVSATKFPIFKKRPFTATADCNLYFLPGHQCHSIISMVSLPPAPLAAKKKKRSAPRKVGCCNVYTIYRLQAQFCLTVNMVGGKESHGAPKPSPNGNSTEASWTTSACPYSHVSPPLKTRFVERWILCPVSNYPVLLVKQTGGLSVHIHLALFSRQTAYDETNSWSKLAVTNRLVFPSRCSPTLPFCQQLDLGPNALPPSEQWTELSLF